MDVANFYEHILSSMEDGVIAVDFEGRIRTFNPAAARILNLPVSAVLGQSYRDIFFATEGNDAFNDALIDIIVTRSRLTRTETVFVRDDGEPVPLSMTGTLLQDDEGQAYGVLLVVADLTETHRRQSLRAAFGRYVAPSVLELIENHPESILLEPEEREITVLFADIRGFTALSEKLEPSALLGVLQEYLAIMVAATTEFGGTVDKFMGDAVMSLFNAPLPQTHHAEMAVRTGLAIQQRVAELNARCQRAIRVDVGICTGRVVVGNVGSEQRLDYTAIGDTVNIASRLEGLNKHYDTGIIVSQSVYEQVESFVKARELGHVRVRGKTRAVSIHAIESMPS